MDAKQAVAVAKGYVSELFAEEGAGHIGLEEIRFDPVAGRWEVTIGFSRAWEGPQGIERWRGDPLPRTFKTVEVNDADGRVLDMKHRSVAA